MSYQIINGHIGNLIITKENLEQYAALQSVTGDMYIEAEGASLPALQSVIGDMYISAKGASLPALQSVTGYVDIRAEGAHVPALGDILVKGDKFYLIRLRDGQYRAGCRGPWTAAEALAHWSGESEKCKRFRAAINQCEKGKS